MTIMWRWKRPYADQPPRRRDNRPPRRAKIAAAESWLNRQGFMVPLLACWESFFDKSFQDTDAGRNLMQARQRGRVGYRRRAMGVGSIRVDIRLGLLDDLVLPEGGFADMAAKFRAASEFSADGDDFWTDAQILRIVFRYGLKTRYLSKRVAMWPSCYYGGLTSALWFAQDELKPSQVRASRIDMQRGCDLSCDFANTLWLGGIFGEGLIYVYDACQMNLQPIRFSRASIADFERGGAGGVLILGDDLASSAPGSQKRLA